MRSLHRASPPPPERAADAPGPVRRAERHADEALTGTTRRWLRHLPVARRPVQLCTAYPRVANRLAWHWGRLDEALAVLDDLLTDQRGGRSGFPREVTRELRRLRDYCERGATAAAEVESGVLAALRRAWPWHWH